MNDNFSVPTVDIVGASVYNGSMSPVFIAFSGKKQVGKDTATEMAVEMLQTSGKVVGVTAFAEVLKDIVVNAFGINKGLVYGSNEDKDQLTHLPWDKLPRSIRWKYKKVWYKPLRKGYMTVRELLQVLGSDIFRQMFEYNVWANSPFRRNWSDYDVVIITDCRFPNEKTVTEEWQGHVVRLERATGLEDDHISETALDGVLFNILYTNEGTLDELRDFVRGVLQKLELL